MSIVNVRLGPRSYEIAIDESPRYNVDEFIKVAIPRTKLLLVISDENTVKLGRLIEDRLREAEFVTQSACIPAGESSKCLSQAERLYDVLYGMSVDRHSAILAVGGGVVGDLAGFVAATWNRGIPLIMIPTTLLAMVDSSVGGKTGINHPRGKNLIGVFHQPRGVWIETDFLSSLPEREYLSGLAEVVKYGVILDEEFFAFLEENVAGLRRRDPKILGTVITRCCQLKANIVEMDEREETGLRAILNYGHTFAHAFEAVGGFGAWLHGEAVAAGMMCAARLALRKGLVDVGFLDRQKQLLQAFNLPVSLNKDLPVDELVQAMRRDKKAHRGQLRFVLPVRLGEVRLFEDIPEDLVRDLLING